MHPAPRPDSSFDTLLAASREIARSVASPHADHVDQHARFPHETLEALRQASVLSAPVPQRWGGAGCNLTQLAQLCATVAQGCGASGMVLAMHYSQLACLAHHGIDSPHFSDELRLAVEEQTLFASLTSEVGTSGDTRSSRCAIVADAHGGCELVKEATTGSYAAHADAILVTCRRHAEAVASDQVLVMVRRAERELQPTSSWNTLGMRGTCSPGFHLHAHVPATQILPVGFGEIAEMTMVPYSHVLWSAVWWGIAADALSRAAGAVRAEARRLPGTLPATAMQLADASTQLQTLRQHWLSTARAYDETASAADRRAVLSEIGWSLRLNHLKVSSAEAAPRIVHLALQMLGIPGYKNDSPQSVSRHYRDVLSAPLMISNQRIQAASASMLMIHKDTYVP